MTKSFNIVSVEMVRSKFWESCLFWHLLVIWVNYYNINCINVTPFCHPTHVPLNALCLPIDLPLKIQ